jgi:hypothetical protein
VYLEASLFSIFLLKILGLKQLPFTPTLQHTVNIACIQIPFKVFLGNLVSKVAMSTVAYFEVAILGKSL